MYTKKAERFRETTYSLTAIPPPCHPEDDEGGLEVVQSVTIQEMWRQSALIVLDQLIYRLPANDEKLQRSLKQIQRLHSSLHHNKSDTAHVVKMFINPPIFLAATVAIEQEDRLWATSTIAKAAELACEWENVEFLQRLHKEQDRVGPHVEWVSWRASFHYITQCQPAAFDEQQRFHDLVQLLRLHLPLILTVTCISLATRPPLLISVVDDVAMRRFQQSLASASTGPTFF